jgi:hypothetical protein
MKLAYWIIAVVLGVAIAGGWTYLQRRDATPAGSNGPAAGASPASISATAVIPTESSPTAASLAETAEATGDQVARWIVDVDSTDAAKRAAAITALAHAPRAQSLPVLRRVLLNGEPTFDRPLALKSLRELAVTKGDADNGVRQVLREVIYHGDDEQFAASAQEAMDTVEQSEQKLAQH